MGMQEGTRWSIIAAGEGANRISFLYYAKFRNITIDDRVLLLNTTTADVRPEKTFEYMLTKDPNFGQIYDGIKREKICIFGKSPSGAGNNWKVGENEAKEDFDTIRRYISNLKLGGRDVIFGISTLGGGTGNGSLPYIIHELKYGRGVVAPGENGFMALGILPYDFEAPQRFFNTICGISRLLRFGESSKQNADLLILVDNDQVEKILGISEASKEERYYKINQEIIKVIDLMIAPGSEGTMSTIDVSDYYQLPGNLGVYHFTPCLSLGNDPDIFSVEMAMEDALRNPMAPIDPKTAIMVYVIVIAPKKYVDNGTFTQEELEYTTRNWAVKNLAGNRGGILRYSSLVADPNRDTLDVMLLMGGFSLKDIISKSLERYYDFKDNLRTVGGEMEIRDDIDERIRVRIGVKDIEMIENNIKDYIAVTEDKIKKASRAEIDVKRKLSEWGFSK